MTLHKKLFKNLAVGDWFYTENSITGTICLHRKTTTYKHQKEDIERVNCVVWERSSLAYCDPNEEVMFVDVSGRCYKESIKRENYGTYEKRSQTFRIFMELNEYVKAIKLDRSKLYGLASINEYGHIEVNSDRLEKLCN